MSEQTTSETLMLAYLCIVNETEASLVRKVSVLDRFNLSDSDIAKVCGVNVQSVRNARQVSKKGGNSGRKGTKTKK